MEMNNYVLSKKIGSGAFGSVFLGYNHFNAERCAIKQIKNEKRFKDCALKEIKILKEIKEKNNGLYPIIEYQDEFIDNDIQYLVFEFMKMNLYEYYNRNNIYMSEVIYIIQKVTLGLKFIHELGIIHSDLKPENIMINPETQKIKIIDLGSAKYNLDKNNNFYIQSRYYRSPEVIFELKYDVKIDIWSLGCIMYELLFKNPLFKGRNIPDMVNLFSTKIGVPNLISEYYTSKWFKYYFSWDFKKNMYVRNIVYPKNKIYFNIDSNGLIRDLKIKMINVKYFQKNKIIDLLRRIIVYNPKERWEASQILNHNIMEHHL